MDLVSCSGEEGGKVQSGDVNNPLFYQAGYFFHCFFSILIITQCYPVPGVFSGELMGLNSGLLSQISYLVSLLICQLACFKGPDINLVETITGFGNKRMPGNFLHAEGGSGVHRWMAS